MNTASRAQRDIQRRCACGATVTVTRPMLYHVTVQGPRGGTMRAGGFDCPRCGEQNQIPAGHMPNGLLPQLPSRDRLISGSPRRAPYARDPMALGKAPSAAAAPAWATGPDAGALVRRVLAAARDDIHSHQVVALAPGADGLEDLGVAVLFGVEGDVLAHLDRLRVELLVVSHVRDGVPSKLVAHPTAGVASIVADPA